MFNKKTDFPTILANTLLLIIGIGAIVLIVSIPFFSIYGVASILDLFNVKDLVTMNYYNNFFMNFIYISFCLISIWILVMILELLFIVAKKKRLFNLQSKLEKTLLFLAFIIISAFITKQVILEVFQRVHTSGIFVVVIFFVIYFVLFIISDTYKKEKE
ncbi:hypothetical protein [Peribacillus muralis]|uniref:hypothetical protein n=1 Tax=Peribacillus muralis TaxID=264697 RepID=UPI00366E5614